MVNIEVLISVNIESIPIDIGEYAVMLVAFKFVVRSRANKPQEPSRTN